MNLRIVSYFNSGYHIAWLTLPLLPLLLSLPTSNININIDISHKRDSNGAEHWIKIYINFGSINNTDINKGTN